MKKSLLALLVIAYTTVSASHEEKVKILSSDGTEFTFEVTIIEQLSETIKNLIEDTGIEHPIPLPNVNTITLNKIKELSDDLKSILANNALDYNDRVVQLALKLTEIIQTTSISIGYELLQAINYLDVRNLNSISLLPLAISAWSKRYALTKDIKPEDIVTGMQPNIDAIIKTNLAFFTGMNNRLFKCFPPLTIQIPKERPNISIAFSPDSQLLAVGGQSDIFVFKDNTLLRTIPTNTAAVALNFSENGKEIFSITASSNSVNMSRNNLDGDVLHSQRINTTEELMIREFLAISPDNKLIATTTSNYNVVVIDAITGNVLHTFEVEPNALAFSHNSEELAVGKLNGQIVIFNLRDPKSSPKIVQKPTGNAISSLSFSPDNLYLAVTIGTYLQGTSRGVKVLNLTSDNLEHYFAQNCGDQNATQPQFLSDGRYLAAQCANQILLWDVKTTNIAYSSGNLVRSYSLSDDKTIKKFIFSPDGLQLAAITTTGPETYIWQLNRPEYQEYEQLLKSLTLRQIQILGLHINNKLPAALQKEWSELSENPLVKKLLECSVE